jgi:hypothetical protein
VQCPEDIHITQCSQCFWFLPKFIACTLPCAPLKPIFGRKYDLLAVIYQVVTILLSVGSRNTDKLFVFCTLLTTSRVDQMIVAENENGRNREEPPNTAPDWLFHGFTTFVSGTNCRDRRPFGTVAPALCWL